MCQVFETRKIFLASFQLRSLVYKVLSHSAKYVGGALSLEGLCCHPAGGGCGWGGGERGAGRVPPRACQPGVHTNKLW